MESSTLVERLTQALQPDAARLAAAYLFGSQARGDARSSSDIDVAVLFLEDPPPTLAGLGLDLAADLEDALGHKVDLVVLNRASPDLVHRVLRDGILVLETDRDARVCFEVKKRNEYFDLLPYLRLYRRTSDLGHGRP